jgi:pimeloyl-ACP methyl ester carboxylesterase
MKPRALLLHGGPGPSAELRVLEGIGHFPWLERPGIVYDEVVDFVAAHSL